MSFAEMQGSTMPQHKTFAHSKEDILGALSFYFGQPVSPEKLKDYNEHHAATLHFPDAYVGQNTQLRDTINNLVEKSPQTWHTTVGLPFRRIEGTVVEWDEIRFDVRLMNRVPYEGVSRMTTSTKRKHRDRIVRRGLAMMIESDFYTTPAGSQHFSNQLQSIRYCVQETCNYDVLFAYLTTSNYDFNYDKTHGVRPRRNVRQAMKTEVSMYACVQKDDRGLDMAVEDAKYRMKRYGVTLSLYMALAPDERITYKEGGPAAIANFEAGAEGFTTRAFRGCGVVTSDPFTISEDTEAVQMLQRFSQVGEFYVMKKPDGGKFSEGHADIVIFDEEADRHMRIKYMDAAMATGLCRVKQGDPNAVNVEEQQDRAELKSDDQLKAMGLTDGADTDITGGKLSDWGRGLATGDSPIVLARPFIEHAMLSAVVTVSGADTGATIFGPSDMQIAANTSVKVIEGHYTGHFKSVVTKPQNVLVLKDIMANGYRAGGNTKFFVPEGDLEVGREKMQERLNFENVDEDPASMLAFPMLNEQYNSGSMDTVMSVTTRLLPYEVNGGTKNHSSFPGGQVMFEFYEGKLGLRAVHFGEDLRATENMEYMSQGSTNNALCFLGPHRKFDVLDGRFNNLVPGMGHWGPDARPGDARWRRGESVNMVSAREQMLTYEQIARVPVRNI